jgi:hypothetical protein
MTFLQRLSERSALGAFARIAVFSAAATTLGGCAHTARFKDQAVVWKVDDAHPIAEPEENEYLKLQYFADVFALRRLDRALELRDHEPARNSNALDEAPDSTWFQNRIGRRWVTPEEIMKGPGGGPPQAPLVITGAKVGGGNPGFIVKDATGKKFLLKFDPLTNPEMQTAGDAIGIRMMWAIGYNVPSDNVFVMKREDLVFGKEPVTFKDSLGRKQPLTDKEISAALATSPRLPDGNYRVLASELLSGKPKGGWMPEGVRGDDENDLIPHEHRREVRGLRVFTAWLNQTDMKQDNTLDIYVEEGGKHFLRHYLIDFGEAFGGHAGEKDRDEDGYEHYIDWENQSKALLALGFWKRPWESRVHTPWLSIGAFSALDFEPVRWREAYPYFPFFETDEADSYWAAKIVMRFERRQIEAAVAAGQLSQPEAAKYLVDTLVARQRKIGLAYLETVTPIDELTIRDGALCGVDLGVRFKLATGGAVVRLGPHDEELDRVSVTTDGGFCLAIPPGDAYTVYRLSTYRGRDQRRAMAVHFKGGPAARVLGIIRREP